MLWRKPKNSNNNNNNPKMSHEKAVKRIIRYLKRTKDEGLIMQVDKTEGIECFVDADFAAMSARLPIPMELIQGKDIVRTGSRSLVSNLTYSHQKTTKTQQKVIFIVFHLSPLFLSSSN
jgi:hypothetical protein